jgi:hypothetical protein
MSPQDVLQGQRNIAPRTNFQPKIEGGRTSRDDRRRATHNEGKKTFENDDKNLDTIPIRFIFPYTKKKVDYT